jgi:hypothetical protein
VEGTEEDQAVAVPCLADTPNELHKRYSPDGDRVG